MNVVCRHDTSLIQPLLPVVVCNLSQFTGIQRIEAINVITACWNNDPALLHILNNSGLAVMITYRDTSAQIAILKLLNRIFDILSDYDISQMLNLLVKAYPDHESVECRVTLHLNIRFTLSSAHILFYILRYCIILF